jgi:hypothetical protein
MSRSSSINWRSLSTEIRRDSSNAVSHKTFPEKVWKIGPLLFMLAFVIGSVTSSATEVVVRRIPDGGVQPQVAVDDHGIAHLIYLKGDPNHCDIFYVHSDDGGRTWSEPLRVNSQAGSAVAIGTVRGAQLALGRGGRVHVAWMGSSLAEPKAAGKLAPMLYSRLADDRRTFEPQRNVIQSHPGLDGGGSIAADQAGNVFVAWHAPSAPGAGEQSRQVWVAKSSDDGKSFAPELPVSKAATGACGCCGLRILAAEGKLVVLYRAASNQVNRGMYLGVVDDGLKEANCQEIAPMKSGICVMSTSALSLSSDGVLAAWETKEQIAWGKLSFAAPQKLGAHTLSDANQGQKHPAIATNPAGEILLTWAEGTGWNRGGTVGWALLNSLDDQKPRSTGHATGLQPWNAPVVFSSSQNVFVILY